MFDFITILFLVALFIIWKMFKVVPMRENWVKERLGKFAGVLQPGFHFFLPFLDRVAYRHEMREQVIDIPSQRCITRDNVEVEVDGLVYLKVMDPEKASYGIGNYYKAATDLAQTTMRSEVGKLDLDDTFKERDRINEKIVQEIDKASEAWGIKFLRYEIRKIEPSPGMIDTLEKQMEAERQKRAEITLALAHKEARINVSEGERQEAINISEGEKIKRINEAEGRSQEITLIANATAEGIRLIAEAIKKPGGQIAVRMRVVQQYIEELGNILRRSKISIVPAGLANLRGFFEGLGSVGSAIADVTEAPNVSTAPKAGKK